jgi:hypothetical protein
MWSYLPATIAHLQKKYEQRIMELDKKSASLGFPVIAIQTPMIRL